MNVRFSPMRHEETLALSKSGDILTVNGDPFDFSTIPEGTGLSPDDMPSDWITQVDRDVSGKLTVTMILPIAADAPMEARFPEALADVADGAVPLPGAGPDHATTASPED